jgi:hypothetical protein
MSRPLNKIAAEILTLWGPKPTTSAAVIFSRPYVEAMLDLNKITDMYGCDSADDIVMRFLVNAERWTGPDAKRIKAELNAMLKEVTDK